MIVRRPSGFDYGPDDELPFVAANHLSSQAHPDGLLDERDIAEWREELRQKQRRRRPMGFTAKWEDER